MSFIKLQIQFKTAHLKYWQTFAYKIVNMHYLVFCSAISWTLQISQ